MKKGFTLIEMIITITVIIILSAISVPIYKNYQQQAIVAEGYVLLGVIREAQKNYYSEWGNFLHHNQSNSMIKGGSAYTSNEEVLGIDARGNKYFTWFSVGRTNASNSLSAMSHYVLIEAVKPTELRGSNDTSLALQYNISLGYKIIDFPKDIDSSWY